MKVFVTGATGWLGQAVLAALKEGRAGIEIPGWVRPTQIRCLVEAGTTAPEGCEVYAGDLRSQRDCREAFEGMEGALVLHLAGIIHPRRVEDFFAINERGTRHVLEAAESAGCSRAVIMSSNSPLGCNPHPDHVFDEGDEYNPYMGYGKSKQRMEEVVHEVHSRGKLPCTLIRAPWFYGPYQPPRQTLFFRMIRDGKMPMVGPGFNRRSMAYTENLAQGVLLAAFCERARGETYWIADERPYPMTEIVSTVGDVLEQDFGYQVKRRNPRLPFAVGQVAQLIDGTLQRFGLYHQKFHVLSEMNKSIACTIEKAKRDLGYQPKVDLREGMRRSVQWCKENGQEI